MVSKNELLTKRDLAKLFQVSETTVGNWLTRGCPYAMGPGPNVGDGYGFNLEAVVEWRCKQANKGKPQGGRKLETMPRELWDRPDLENGARYLREFGARHYIRHWMQDPEGLQLVFGLLMETHDDDRAKAVSGLNYVVYSLFTAFSNWVAQDEANNVLIEQGSSFDDLWYSYSGERLTTSPPKEPGKITLTFPDWFLKLSGGPEAFFREHGSNDL